MALLHWSKTVFPSLPVLTVMVYMPEGKPTLLKLRATELVEDAPLEQGPVKTLVTGTFKEAGPVIEKSEPFEAMDEQAINSEKLILTELPPQTEVERAKVGGLLSKI